MCGIVAIYHPQGRVSGEALGRATARLHHRGPDGQRQWIAPTGESDWATPGSASSTW